MNTYNQVRWALVLVLLGLCVAASARRGKYFDRASCKAEIEEMQQKGNFTKNNATYFLSVLIDGVPRILNESDNMTVTYAGCEEFCGPWSWYWDVGPRLTTWIIPVCLLLSNIELSPIDKKRYMTIAHAIGDPIDSFWSLIHKIYIWHRLYEIAWKKSAIPGEVAIGGFWRFVRSIQDTLMEKVYRFCEFWRWPLRPRAREMTREDRARIIATVLAGFEEISGAMIKSEDYYYMVLRQLLGNPADFESEIFQHWRRTARTLADARTDEFLRTCLAVVVYILGLVAAFIPSVGGENTTPPGGRIGGALFISWLVPLTLLSNTVGAFTSRRTCLTIMRQFVQAATQCLAPKPVDVEPQTNPVLEGTTPQRNASESTGNTQVAEPSRSRELQARSSRTSLAPSGTRRNVGHLAIGPTETEPGPTSSSSLTLEPGNFRRLSNRAHAPSPRSSSNQREKLSVVDDVKLEPTTPAREIPKWPGRLIIPDGKEVFCPERDIHDPTGLIMQTSWNDYFESLQWLGSIYTYRPWKVMYLDIDPETHSARKSVLMALGGFFPVFVSAAGAFDIMWYAVPTGFSCRNVWVVAIFSLYIFSAAYTSLVYQHWAQKVGQHGLWLRVLVKDLIIGIGSLLMIFLSTAGAFNNCWCWSRGIILGKNGFVPLNTDKGYKERAQHNYSIAVGMCLGIQILFYFGLVFWWHHGVKLVRWAESRRRREWGQEMSGDVVWKEDNYLLFWYSESQLSQETEDRQRRHTEYIQRVSSIAALRPQSTWARLRRTTV